MSPWASPIVIVPKKTEPGEPPRRRMCVDYRMLNSLLPPVNKAHSKAKGIVMLVPLPKIDKKYAQLQGSKIFSALDMRSGYFHIELSEEAKPKTAFVPGGPHGSKYQFNRCPFGLSQAPAYFQRLVYEVLRGLPFTFGYLDDILIFSSGVEAHLEHLRKVFLRLREAKLKLKASKCSFFKKHIQYLGHLVSGDGMEAVENMPPPKTPKEVRQFLGLVGYYRKFVPKFADIARPLTNLTKQDVKYVLPVDSVISHIPTFNQFGRKTKLNLNPNVPDLKWKVSDTLNTKTPIIPIKIEKVNTQTTQLTLK